MDGLLIDDTGAILRLTLDRPDKFNALTADLIHAVADSIEQTTAHVVVLTGNGKAFCSGADVSGDKPSMDTLYAANRLTMTILESATTVIAAVNGIAAGVGVSFALACDQQVVKQSAAFMLAFTKIGLMPDGGASLLVPAAVGRARAARMALLAEKIPAPQAAEWGLVSHVVSDEDFDAEVERVVGAVAAAAPLALARTKQSINAATVAQMRAIQGLEAAGQETLMFTDDFAEGVAAFQGKRAANFTGR